MAGYRLSGEGYTDEEMRVLKRMCKSMLADIDEFLRKKEEKKKKELHALTFPLGEMSNWAGSC